MMSNLTPCFRNEDSETAYPLGIVVMSEKY